MNWWVVCRLTELTKKVEWIILEEIIVVIAGGIYMGNKQQAPHWIPCPICNEKTEIKIYKDTVLFNFPLYCPRCKKEVRIDVMQLKMAKSK